MYIAHIIRNRLRAIFKILKKKKKKRKEIGSFRDYIYINVKILYIQINLHND